MTERDSLDSTGLYNGMSMNVKSRNDIEYYNSPPEQVYLSKSKSKDSMELLLLKELNRVVDMAIEAANNQFYMEASEIIQTNIFDGLFDGIDPRFHQTRWTWK
jgi:hypothetical protein